MATYRIQVELPWDSGLPEDVTVNVWHCTAPDLAGAEDFMLNLVGFYQSIDDRFSNIISIGTDVCSMKAYNLADPEPRAPNETIFFTLPDALGQPIPPENAICLSFQGDRISGQAQARRRGRVYLGPLNDGCVGSDGRVTSAATGDIVAAADVLLTASGTWDWVVYSPTNDGTVLVTNGWVDNEFDHQLRRGRLATIRSTFQ